ncbi:MAG: EAL domain-containing protein [Gloeocapsa sp. UFS-A4-WI-NPMV-4B04]|jgi:diguanylate cyclase (GGDEF)-like protein|nr:EAL domain-containing protein [Gloeocapsa sp. UFS-A4-WI-NPMV-4B04]
MILRNKTLLIVGATLVSLIGVIYGTSSKILLSGFAKVEAQNTKENVQRVQDALSEEINKLDLTTTDWAQWDDSYAFVQNANKTYLNRHLSNLSISRLELNLMLYVHSSGRIVVSKGYDLERNKDIPILNNFQKHFSHPGLLQHPNTKASLTGIVLLPENPIIISSRPILTSESEGPIKGTLILGRFLDASISKRLGERTHLSVTMHRFDDPKMPRDFQAVRSSFSPRESIIVRKLSEETVAGYTSIKDIYGKPAVLMRVDIPRRIYKQGQLSIRYLGVSLLIVGLVLVAATLLILEKLILSRLFRLSADVYNIGTTGNLSARVLSLSGKDELARLGSTINEMLAALEHSLNKEREREKRHYTQNKTLAELAKRKMLEFSNLNARLSEITEAAAHTLKVERVSVWLYNDEQSKLRCLNLYERSTNQHSEGIELDAANYPAYFQALKEDRTIAIDDAQNDSRTKELSRAYLSSSRVTSMLDAPVWLGGQMVGVVCHEHIGDRRDWCLEDNNFAASISDLISLTIEASERKRSQEELRLAHDELEIRVTERTTELAKANIELQSEVIERKIAEAQLIHDAFHDSLTSLPNRALFVERLGRVIERSKRIKNYFFAVLFLDLDRFKLVNDSLGHFLGDQLLIAFVRRLEVCVRNVDTIARLGGDEFVILLDNINDINDATQVADRIQNELSLPFKLNGHEVFISTSIGIALSTTAYENAEEILRDADTVMYRAKALGKARYEVFDQDMHTRVVELLQLENDLRRSLERQELEIYYQPIVCLATGIITGFEALLRWQHPQRGFVSPVEFIPIAEETGMIVPIGYWVLREACHQMSVWQKHFNINLPLTISVNFSGKQFSQPDLIKQVAQILQDNDFDAHNLKVEITESVLIENADSAAGMLVQLKKLGIQVYIDDFGTGYSSLSYLHRFPIDALKIDRSFISRMNINNESEIVQTIMTMAHNLGMSVVAEGIETIEQLNQLKSLQCEYGQGYLFAKPLNKEAAEAWISKEAPLVNQNVSSL